MRRKILAVDMSTGVAEMDWLHYDFFEAIELSCDDARQ